MKKGAIFSVAAAYTVSAQDGPGDSLVWKSSNSKFNPRVVGTGSPRTYRQTNSAPAVNYGLASRTTDYSWQGPAATTYVAPAVTDYSRSPGPSTYFAPPTTDYNRAPRPTTYVAPKPVTYVAPKPATYVAPEPATYVAPEPATYVAPAQFDADAAWQAALAKFNAEYGVSTYFAPAVATASFSGDIYTGPRGSSWTKVPPVQSQFFYTEPEVVYEAPIEYSWPEPVVYDMPPMNNMPPMYDYGMAAFDMPPMYNMPPMSYEMLGFPDMRYGY